MRSRPKRDACQRGAFNILLEYHQGRIPLYHFDLYRLDEQDELEDTGYYDTVDADGVSFIEWGEKFPGALPYGYLEVRILVAEDGGRRVFAHALGNRARQLLTVWASDSKARRLLISIARRQALTIVSLEEPGCTLTP